MQRDTQQRRAIREAFVQLGRPLNTQEVLEAAQRNTPGLGIATVYRAIKALVDEGWLTTVDLPGEASPRYELADLPHHHHFHCTQCGRVFDIDGCTHAVESLAPEGCTVAHHDIVLYGLCAACGTPAAAGGRRKRQARNV